MAKTDIAVLLASGAALFIAIGDIIDGRNGPRRGGRCHQATRVSTTLVTC